MVDRERVHERLGRLDPLLARLEAARARGAGAYARDPDARLATERALQLALQVCLDVGAHLVSELGLPPPDEYRQTFLRLRDAGVLDEALATRLAEAANLRNRLVHGYVELDDAQVFAALDALDDLRAFAAAVARTTRETAVTLARRRHVLAPPAPNPRRGQER